MYTTELSAMLCSLQITAMLSSQNFGTLRTRYSLKSKPPPTFSKHTCICGTALSKLSVRKGLQHMWPDRTQPGYISQGGQLKPHTHVANPAGQSALIKLCSNMCIRVSTIMLVIFKY